MSDLYFLNSHHNFMNRPTYPHFVVEVHRDKGACLRLCSKQREEPGWKPSLKVCSPWSSPCCLLLGSERLMRNDSQHGEDWTIAYSLDVNGWWSWEAETYTLYLRYHCTSSHWLGGTLFKVWIKEVSEEVLGKWGLSEIARRSINWHRIFGDQLPHTT